ncbi:MAG TPA: MXAN_5187 C-terminal domain-containing protein [Desulfuromonadales bacterium]|nr:MXAN_5187 C-terminal domain-containing protein [Desulfuromonadales bacterium]
MDERRIITEQLDRIEQAIKELVIAYEQYFAGVEKREPLRARGELNRQLQHFANKRIIQTELRFRYQSLASRFHTYANYWDRILRLMDEGRYVRQKPSGFSARQATSPAEPKPQKDQLESVYRELEAAYRTSSLPGAPPNRQQIAELLDRQREKIRSTFGDRELDFHVVTENGRPRIKVRAKK